MNTTAEQKAFMQSLSEIKSIRNPVERIRQVYELVARSQGHYDDNALGAWNLATGLLVSAETPENILRNAKVHGTGGVCRDFASLLQWSLIQVARHSGSTSSSLGPNDFSSEFVSGEVPGYGGWKDGGGHAWVRINLPSFNSSGSLDEFKHFDVDTTYYPHFAPIFPRRSGVSRENKETLKLQCREMIRCLQEKVWADVSRTGSLEVLGPASRKSPFSGNSDEPLPERTPKLVK